MSGSGNSHRGIGYGALIRGRKREEAHTLTSMWKKLRLVVHKYIISRQVAHGDRQNQA